MENHEASLRRIQVFEDTLQYCERNIRLTQSIQRTRMQTKRYQNPVEGERNLNQTGGIGKGYMQGAKLEVVFVKDRLIEGIKEYNASNHKVGVVNFASAMAPGGGAVRGNDDVEAELCRCSTLYPCLNTEDLREEYYERNQGEVNLLDTCIYTPGIVGVKNGDEWLEPDAWVSFDVISCSFFDLRLIMNGKTNSLDTEPVVDDFNWSEAVQRRLRGIFRVAKAEQMDVLLVNPDGCRQYGYSSDRMIFAVRKAVEESV